MFSKDIKQRLHDHDCGSAVGKGWLPLVEELNRKITAIDPDYKIYQIKEKFGGLRYYIQLSDQLSEQQYDSAYELIRTTEDQSFTICEDCGNPGKRMTQRGWMFTLCNNCFIKSRD